MSADVLRRAAALMRERAETATPGPWECYGDHLVWPSEKGPAANDPILGLVGEAHQDSAFHIASWHPAVGLAVADLLDVWVKHRLLESGGTLPQERAAILAVANAYLQETP